MTWAMEHGVPVIGISSAYASAGTVIAVEPDYFDNGVECAQTAASILAGVKPFDLPLVMPRKFNYFLNQALANRLGIKFSDDVVRGAAEVFGK